MSISDNDLKQLLTATNLLLPGASDSGIKVELYEVLTEFFKESSCWTEQVDFSTIADVTDYTLAAVNGGQIIRLAGIVDSNNFPVPAFMASPPVISLRDTPNTVQTFTATVIENVKLPSSGLVPDAPDWLLPKYHNTIRDGLLSRMMMQPEKSYTDLKRATYYDIRFRNGMSTARVDALQRNTMGAQAWRFPLAGRRGSQRGGVSTADPTRF
jgi:hypothetical protein